MPKAILFIVFLFFTNQLQAQTWEIGGSVGAAGYIGDLNPTNPIKPSGIAAGIFVKRNFDGYFSARLTYSYGRIAAADSTANNQQQRDRNLSFTDGIKELSLIGEFNFMNYIPDAGPNKFTPFIYAGVGLSAYNPRTIYDGSQVNLRPLKTEGKAQYGDNTVVIPYGIGIKYNPQGKFTIAADIGYRYVLSDFLDDVSGQYPEKSALTSNLSKALSDRSGEVTGNYIGSPHSQRGDFKPHDVYFFLGITLSYTFVTQRCYY